MKRFSAATTAVSGLAFNAPISVMEMEFSVRPARMPFTN